MRWGWKNGIRCGTTTVGTGAYTYGAAEAGYLSFALLADGAKFPYRCQFGSEIEWGIGTKTAGTVARTTILQSTNGGGAVNWPNANKKILTIDWLAQNIATSPDGSITISDNPATGETELSGFGLTDAAAWFAANVLEGVDTEIEVDDVLTPSVFTLHTLRRIAIDADAATITIDLSSDVGSTHITEAIDLDPVLAFANEMLGQEFLLKLNYGSAGGGVPTWPVGITWVNGYEPALTPVSNSSDTFKFQVTATGGYNNEYLGWILSTERPKLFAGSAEPSGGVTADIQTIQEASSGNVGVVTTTEGGGGRNAVFYFWRGHPDYESQSLFVSGTVSGGTFTISHAGLNGGGPTAAIAWDATAAEICDAINAVGSIGDLWFAVSEQLNLTAADNAVIILAAGGTPANDLALLTIDSTNLTGGGTLEFSTVHNGTGAVTQPAGTYAITVDGQTASGIGVSSVTPGDLEAIVESLSSVGSGNCVVTQLQPRSSLDGGYRIEFVGSLAGQSPTVTVGEGGLTAGDIQSDLLTGGIGGVVEVQTLSVTGTPTQGSAAVTFDGETTTFPFDCSAANAETLLNALPSIGAGGVSVSGGPWPDTPLVVTFDGEGLLGTDVPEMSVDDSGLQFNEIQEITLSPEAVAGTLTLTFDGETTGDLDYDADLATITAALEGLPNLDDVALTGGPLASAPVQVEFRGSVALTDVPLLTADTSGLVDASAGIEIDWSVCDHCELSLDTGSGNYSIAHRNLIPGKSLLVAITNNGAAGFVLWDVGDAVVDWGVAGAPDMPADGETLYLLFTCWSVTKLTGKSWFV